MRASFKGHPAASFAAILVVIGVVTAWIVYSFWPQKHQPTRGLAYFTDDDGKHWFADDAGKLAPFDHNGKEAVEVRVYVCGTGKPFAGYLLKYTPETKKAIDEARQNVPTTPGHHASVTAAAATGPLIKRPGEDRWYAQTDAESADIRQVKCPDGGRVVTPVLP